MLVRSFVLTATIAAFAVLVLGVPSLTPNSTTDASPVAMPQKGDLNCDGAIDLGDLRTLLAHVGGGGGGGSGPVTACTTVTLGVTGDPVFGDLDCNGVIDANDILILLKYVGIPGIFGKTGEPATSCPSLDLPFPPEPSAYLIGVSLSKGCSNPGDSVTVTVYVRRVPQSRPLRSFEFDLNVNPAGLQIGSLGVQHMLASGASGPLVSTSDATPSTAGTFHVGVEDPSAIYESGDGTLVTLATTVVAGGGQYLNVSVSNVSLVDSAGTIVPSQLGGGGASLGVLPQVICAFPSTGGSPWAR